MLDMQIYLRKKIRTLEGITDFRILFGALIAVYSFIALIFAFAIARTKVIDPKISCDPMPAQYMQSAGKQVNVSFRINNFLEFDILNNQFISNVSVYFMYDEKLIKQAIIDAFTFENAVIMHKSAPVHTIARNEKTIASYDVQLKSKHIFDYRYFPFDRHRINFVIINKHASLDQLVYVTDNQSISIQEDAFTKDWIQYDQSTEYGIKNSIVTLDGEQSELLYERVIFSIDFERVTYKSTFTIFLPLFLIFFIGILSLMFDVLNQFSTILTLSLGSTTALIFYSKDLQDVLPATRTFTLTEMIYVLVLAIILLTLTIQVIMLQYLHKKKSMTQMKEILDYTVASLNVIRSLCFLLFPLIMLIMIALLLLF